MILIQTKMNLLFALIASVTISMAAGEHSIARKRNWKPTKNLKSLYLYNLILTIDISNYEFCSMKYSKFVKQSKVFVCLFVSNKRQNGLTDRAQITWTQGRFMNDPNLKNLAPTKIDFYWILKIHENFSFVFILQCI